MSSFDLKKLQMTELVILKEFDRICRKHNLVYFLDSGTSLGAVRHGGFIPWDDDIDVGMPREDYERFLNIAQTELGEKYFLQTLGTDPRCPYLFAKIRKNGTVCRENNKTGIKMHTGIWIDIFPFDYITSDPEKQKKIISQARITKDLFSIQRIPHRNTGSEGSGLRYHCRTVLRKCIHCLLKLVPGKCFVRKMDKLAHSSNGEKEYMTCLYYGKPLVWKTEGLLPVCKIIFEGTEFFSVRDADYYLTAIYGDYMTLPPEEKRKGHLPAFIDYGEESTEPDT